MNKPVYFIKKALKLALKGFNRVHPNPYVGAIVVKNGKIAGQGFHAFCGGPHAEVNAISASGANASGADLYVTLEPCSTHGRTPPCTDIIIRSGIKKVYFGAFDSNPRNSRMAQEILNAKGVKTEFIDFQKEHDTLNRVFSHCLKSRLPYVNLKAAVSLDARIFDSGGNSQWITSLKSRMLAHKLRRTCDAILVGASTFNKDNPQLNIRLVPDCGAEDPAKIILSASGRLETNNFLVSKDTAAKVIIITSETGAKRLSGKISNRNCSVAILSEGKKNISLKRCLTYIRKTGYHNLLVEGGAGLFRQFVAENLFNELHIVVAPVIFGGSDNVFAGTAPLMRVDSNSRLHLAEHKIINNDIYLRYTCSPE